MLAKIVRKGCDLLAQRRKYLRDCFRPSYLPNDAPAPACSPLIGHGVIARLLIPDFVGAADVDLLSLADKILNHQFDLLGSGPMRISHGMHCPGFAGHSYAAAASPEINSANAAESARIRQMLPPEYELIDWQRDIKSGYRWSENTWSEYVPIGHLPGVDVKVPWELGRLQQLPWLAQAYGAAKRADKYAVEFRHQVLDFLANNPPRWGVQWRCTMDVAIRAANLVVAFDCFRSLGAEFDKQFVGLFQRSLREHGSHIWTHLEWHPRYRNNHYLSNVVGMLYVASYLPPTPTTKEWLTWAVRELANELAFQFERDGGNLEASTFYHRFSAETILYGIRLVQNLPRPYAELLPDWHVDVMERLQSFTTLTTAGSNELCRVGDNDSGRFFALPAPTIESAPSQNSADLLTGLELHAFPLFGLYVYRSRRMHLSIRCGSLGQNGQGGHAHNDQLSIELWLDGRPFIVDPGTFVYTPSVEARNMYRSTAMHNTLTAPGREQNPWPPGQKGLFRLEDRCQTQVVALGKTHFAGVHHGFSVPHKRIMDIFRREIRGLDQCELVGEKVVSFHLAPEVVATPLDSGAVRLANGDRTVCLSSEGGELTIVDGTYAPAYGVECKNRVVVLRSEQPELSWTLTIVSRMGGTP